MIHTENQMTLCQYVSGKDYPGRGIFIGQSPDGENMLIAYFIMGRSENSRNRVFEKEDNNGIKTKAFDPSKMIDPSLIIYSPIRTYKDMVIVTNGDQTDTIYETLLEGGTFWDALEKRTFEPDPPHLTPRISGLVMGEDKNHGYYLSILKSANGDCEQTRRMLYAFEGKKPGMGHLIHTYEKEENGRLLSFYGEPVALLIEGDLESFSNDLWSSLNEDNKISLVVQFINKKNQDIQTKIINKHQ